MGLFRFSSASGSLRSLTGKHVLITGGSSGIGLECAIAFAKERAHVTLFGRDAERLQSARRKALEASSSSDKDSDVSIGIQAVDVGDCVAVQAAIAAVSKERPIDVLLCNAGVVRTGYTEDTSHRHVEEQVRTNFLGTVFPVQAALPQMKARSATDPGAIVIMCSLSGLSYWYGASVYTATKYAQRGFAETLRMELVPFNIRVSVVCPGFTDTPFLDDVEQADEHLCKLMKVASLYDRSSVEDPKAIARKTVLAVKSGSFLVTTSSSPLVFLQAALARGLFPPENVFKWLLETLCLPIFRLFSKLAAFGVCHDIRAAYKTSGRADPGAPSGSLG